MIVLSALWFVLRDTTRSYLRNRLKIVLRPSVNPAPGPHQPHAVWGVKLIVVKWCVQTFYQHTVLLKQFCMHNIHC